MATSRRGGIRQAKKNKEHEGNSIASKHHRLAYRTLHVCGALAYHRIWLNAPRSAHQHNVQKRSALTFSYIEQQAWYRSLGAWRGAALMRGRAAALTAYEVISRRKHETGIPVTRRRSIYQRSLMSPSSALYNEAMLAHHHVLAKYQRRESGTSWRSPVNGVAAGLASNSRPPVNASSASAGAKTSAR